jgi:hypothetical protein
MRAEAGRVWISVRYDAATDTSTVWQGGRAGDARSMTRTSGLVVPHLRSDHGALRAVIASPPQA